MKLHLLYPGRRGDQRRNDAPAFATTRQKEKKITCPAIASRQGRESDVLSLAIQLGKKNPAYG